MNKKTLNLDNEEECEEFLNIENDVEIDYEKLKHEERQKQGLLYNVLNVEDKEDKYRRLNLMNEFNTTDPSDFDKKDYLIRKMFASVGDSCFIETPIHSNWGGKNLHIGNSVYINFNLSMVDDGDIYVGDNVLIGPNVTLITSSHPIDFDLRANNYMYTKDIHIEKRAWICANCVILPGVTIGEGSVIGAGSVVTKDIPANCLAYGNPCKVIREINDYDKTYYCAKKRIDWENIELR